MAQKPTQSRIAENVVPLFDDADAVEEFPVGHKLRPAPKSLVLPANVLDLSNRLKLVAAFGLGGCGKTTLLRYVTERMLERGGEAKVAAIDPEGRSMGTYFPGGVYEPESHDPERVATWLRAFIDALEREKASGILDTGGGDTAFGRVLLEMPDLVGNLHDAGIECVALFAFSPRIESLSALATLSDAGFNPAATALICNEGCVEGSIDPDQAFASVRRHSVYRAALDRGAVELRMPKLLPDLAMRIEKRKLQFRHVRDGVVPDGRKAVPFGFSDRSSLRSWLLRMDAAMAPIASWLP